MCLFSIDKKKLKKGECTEWLGIEGYIDGVIDDVPNKAKTKKEKKKNFVTFF